MLLLLDARIEVKAADRAVMELLDRAAVTFQLVLTKADGVKPAGRSRRSRLRRRGSRARTRPRIPVVSHDQQRDRAWHPELRAAIAGLVA